MLPKIPLICFFFFSLFAEPVELLTYILHHDFHLLLLIFQGTLLSILRIAYLRGFMHRIVSDLGAITSKAPLEMIAK